MNKFNVLIIGLGLIGMRFGFDSKRNQPASHIAAVLANPSLQLIGVCDVDKNAIELFKKKYGNEIDTFDNYTMMIEHLITKKIKCDIIVIATPDSNHGEILKLLITKLTNLTKPLIIFCEKPLTSDTLSAEKLKKISRDPNLKIIVNHGRRWSHIWQEAYRLKKKIGDIESASFYFSTSPENREIIQIRDGIHIADLIHWFNIKEKVTINRLIVPYFIWDFYMWGSHGKIEVLDNGEILNFFKKIKSKRYAGFQELKLSYSKKLRESMLSNAYAEFVKFLGGRIPHLSTDIDDAVSALHIFEKYVYDDKLPERLVR